MLKNISKEIFFYSFIPVLIIAIVIIVLLILGKKKSDNYYKYNYFIKVLLSVLIGFILSLMIGYTIWVFVRLSEMGTISDNVLYLALLCVLVISLFLSLVLLLYKLHKNINEKGLQNE